jgi:hypothetical protein
MKASISQHPPEALHPGGVWVRQGYVVTPEELSAAEKVDQKVKGF